MHDNCFKLRNKIWMMNVLGMHNTTLYNTWHLFNLHVCQVCASYQCPYCLYYNGAERCCWKWSTKAVMLISLFFLYYLSLSDRYMWHCIELHQKTPDSTLFLLHTILFSYYCDSNNMKHEWCLKCTLKTVVLQIRNLSYLAAQCFMHLSLVTEIRKNRLLKTGSWCNNS